jgi:hypothetical protein
VLFIRRGTHMSDDPPNLPARPVSDTRGREHARRDKLQEDLLRRAYKRSVHRTYIEAALRRAGHAVLPKDSAFAEALRIRTID